MSSNLASQQMSRFTKLFLVIPARYASTRLPAKPLILLQDKPMVLWVAERCKNLAERLSSLFSEIQIIVATDHTEIHKVVTQQGFACVMTPPELASGTDRCAYALQTQNLEDALVVNIQGDEPFFSVNDVESLIRAMCSENLATMGTLAYPQNDISLYNKSSVVKVVCDHAGYALYFSRAPIPWNRPLLGASGQISEALNAQKDYHHSESYQQTPLFWQHLGVYAFCNTALFEFTKLPRAFLEEREGLEQLRALSAGWKIRVAQASELPFGIDTPEDVKRAQDFLSSQLR